MIDIILWNLYCKNYKKNFLKRNEHAFSIFIHAFRSPNRKTNPQSVSSFQLRCEYNNNVGQSFDRMWVTYGHGKM